MRSPPLCPDRSNAGSNYTEFWGCCNLQKTWGLLNMPYTVEKSGSKWLVKSPNGIKGTHATKAEAEAQQRALYANTGDEAKPKRRRRKPGRPKR